MNKMAAARLATLCDISTGKKDANEGSPDGVYPFFTCAEKHSYSETFSFDEEAILVAGNANIGRTQYYCGKFEAYQRTYVLRRFRGVDVRYLYSYLNAKLEKDLKAQAQSSAMSYIRLPMLEDYLIPLPPLGEQRKIAEILRTWDEAIETAEAELKAKQERKRWLMEQLIGLGKSQFAKYSSKWPIVQIGTFARSRSGDSSLIKGKMEAKYVQGLYPAYSATGQDIWRKEYDYDETAIIVSAVGARCGRTFIARGKWSAIANTQIIFPDHGQVDAYYLNLFLNNEAFWVRGGSAQPFVIPSKTLKKSIPLPPLSEQLRLAGILQCADGEEAKICEKIEALRTQKRGLMQKLLTGEVRVAA